jgi:nucleoside-diphosphate-sugar epimerase
VGIFANCRCGHRRVGNGMNLLGALPSRFRRERVLIVGCGDVGLRAARELGAGRRSRLMALTSSPTRVSVLRSAGIEPLLGDLDAPATLRRLAGLATRVLHLAPPPTTSSSRPWADPRSEALWQSLARRSPPRRWVYGSTTGVYGDRQGAWVDETSGTRASTPRAWRRVDAERAARRFALNIGSPGVVLRIPGIYAPDRAGGTPRERLAKGLPVLVREQDVYTNHIHADDLARACAVALWRGAAHRVVNVVDDTEMLMGDYVDLAADLYGLPRPRRLDRDQAAKELTPMTLSFMGESRRLRNQRLKTELRLQLHYAHVRIGLVSASGRGPNAVQQPSHI